MRLEEVWPFRHDIPLWWFDENYQKEDVMSDLYQSLSHSRWNCKYPVAFIPRRRREVLFGGERHQLGEIIYALTPQKGAKSTRNR